MKQEWFDYSIVDDFLHIDFKLSDGRFFPVNIIETDITDILSLHKINIRISGKGSVWMYSFIVYSMIKNSAKNVEVYNPSEKYIKVYPILNDEKIYEDSSIKWFTYKELSSTEVFLEIIKKPNGGFWPIDAMKQVINIPSFTDKKVYITGPGAIWMYAALAAKAASENAKAFYLYSPKDTPTYAINISYNYNNQGLLVNLIEDLLPARSGEIIAVLGDPNSGKSVFSDFLYKSCSNDKIWKFDCDAASPTSGWFIELLKDNPKEATEIRNNQKVKWTVVLEDMVAIYMENLKKYLTAVIADFPGGKHTKDISERIPPHREVMLSKVDKIIIITKNESITTAWINELKKHNLDNKIRAIITSFSPEKPVSLVFSKNNDIIIGEVTGLDRKKDLSNNNDIIKKFNSLMNEILLVQ